MSNVQQKICLIGVGAIGISFAALHLRYTDAVVAIYDPREDIEQHIDSVLPGYLDSNDGHLQLAHLKSHGRLLISGSLEEACKDATIVQEQGPEKRDFKQDLWPQVERHVSPTAHLWSSTSGIGASIQTVNMVDKTRLLVVHPFNPPHIMPLVEIVPSPITNPAEVEFAREYFTNLGSGHRPVVIHKEVPGFVGNRLAFTLFREACYVVDSGVISARDLDTLMEASLGPRWAVQGPFKSYNMGGSSGGLAAFLQNLGGTMQDIWNDTKAICFGDRSTGKQGKTWEDVVVQQTTDAYGKPDTAQYKARDDGLRRVLEAQQCNST